jgi:hypothetical protein
MAIHIARVVPADSSAGPEPETPASIAPAPCTGRRAP